MAAMDGKKNGSGDDDGGDPGANALEGFMPLREWLLADGAGLFVSLDAAQWWLRQRPEELRRCKDYMIGPSRSDRRMVGPGFRAWVLAAFKRDSDAKLKLAAERKRARAAARGNQPG